MGAGLRYPLHPSPHRRELGCWRPLLRRGVEELKSTRGNLSGQRVNGLRCPLPCPAFVSARPRHALSSAHTAEVDLTEVGSKTLWAFAPEAYLPVGFLRVGLQAGRPYGLALAAVAVDSVEARLPGLASIPSKSRH